MAGGKVRFRFACMLLAPVDRAGRKELHMRPVVTSLSVVLLASSAVAAPKRPLDIGTVPLRCLSASAIPPSSLSAEPGLSAEVSTASCVGEGAVADPTLT